MSLRNREAELSALFKAQEGMGGGVVLDRRCSVQYRENKKEMRAYIAAWATFDIGPLLLHLPNR